MSNMQKYILWNIYKIGKIDHNDSLLDDMVSSTMIIMRYILNIY
jgi:hypothetical protein